MNLRNLHSSHFLVCLVSFLSVLLLSLIILFSPYQYVVILICMENSFWQQPNSISFNDSFLKAFKLFIKSGTREKLENSFKMLKGYPPSYSNNFESFNNSSLLEILLEHRLRRFLISFLSTFIYSGCSFSTCWQLRDSSCSLHNLLTSSSNFDSTWVFTCMPCCDLYTFESVGLWYLLNDRRSGVHYVIFGITKISLMWPHCFEASLLFNMTLFEELSKIFQFLHYIGTNKCWNSKDYTLLVWDNLHEFYPSMWIPLGRHIFHMGFVREHSIISISPYPHIPRVTAHIVDDIHIVYLVPVTTFPTYILIVLHSK